MSKTVVTALTAALLLVIGDVIAGLTCTYNFEPQVNTVTCGQQACDTAVASGLGPLPRGTYGVGPAFNNRTLNLYPIRSNGSYWDYYSPSPDHQCRSRFGLHCDNGTVGVTVTDDGCFQTLKELIEAQGQFQTNVWSCVNGTCAAGGNNSTYECTDGETNAGAPQRNLFSGVILTSVC